jgi:hypothetical protein
VTLLLDAIALKVDRKPVTLGEVLASSLIGGWLAPVMERISDELACSALAAERQVKAPADRLQEAMNDWRIQRDLIAADEMRAWLEMRGVSLEDLAAHLERGLLHARLSAHLDEARRSHAPGGEEILDLLPLETVCSGEIEELAEDFGLRAVVPPSEEMNDGLEEAGRGILSELGMEDIGEVHQAVAFLGVSRDRTAWLFQIESAFRLFRDEALSEGRLQEALAEMREDLASFEVVTTFLANEDVALELLCCIRVDNDTFERAVTRASAGCWKESWFGSDLPDRPFGHRLPAARRFDLFGPEPRDGEYLVMQLLSRQEPGLDQPDVAARLSRRLLRRTLMRPLAQRVSLPQNDLFLERTP